MGQKNKKFTESTVAYNGPLLDQSFFLFAEVLNTQKVIRLYVDGTAGMGHQASSIRVLRELTGKSDSTDLGYAYEGTVEVYYQMRPSGENTLEKLFLLLPQLNGQKQGYINSAWIKLIELTAEPPKTNIQFGFAGGADDYPNKGVPNFADSLNVNYFLRLQPYYWKETQGIHRKNGDLIDFEELEEFGGRDFWYRSYYQPPPFLTTTDWEQYLKAGGELQRQAEILQWLISRAEAKQFDLQFVYGVRSFACPMMPEFTYQVLVNIISSVLQWQQRINGDPRENSKSAVIVNLDEFVFVTNDHPSIQDILNVLRGDTLYHGDESSGRYLRAFKNRQAYFQNYLRAADRVQCQDGGTYEDVARKTEWLCEQNNRVLFVQLGKVPPPLFNYVYLKSTLPRVFEGMGTANLALSVGNWYFHVARPNVKEVIYPDTTFDLNRGESAGEFQTAANFIRYDLFYSRGGDCWPDTGGNLEEFNGAAPYEIGTFMQKFVDEEAGASLREYLSRVKEFYANPNNGKLRMAANYLYGVFRGEQKKVLALMDAGITLPALYEALTQQVQQSGKVDLWPGTLQNLGEIGTYYGKLLDDVGADRLVIDPARLERNPDGDLKWIKLSGKTTTPLGPTDNSAPVDAELEFTAPTNSIRLSATFTETNNYVLANIPWIPVTGPFQQFVTTDGLAVVGAVGATIKDIKLRLSYQFPAVDNLWSLTGTFEDPPGIERLFGVMGGINLLETFEGPFKTITALKATGLQLLYNTKNKRLESVAATAATTEKIDLIPDRLSLDAFEAILTVTSPASMASRTTRVDVTGNFKIGRRADAGVIQIGASFPGLALRGELVSGHILLEDLLGMFLPGVPLQLPKLPSIDAFIFSYLVKSGDYSVNCQLNIDWPIVVQGKTIFTILGVGFQVTNTGGSRQGFLSGSVIILPDDPDVSLAITVSATYLGKDLGWVFKGQQTSGQLPLGKLLHKYLGWETDQKYGIDGLSLTMSTNDSSWVFTGKTAQDFDVPFISGLTFSASLKAGYNGKQNNARAMSELANSTVALVLDDSDQVVAGPFARLETNWRWNNIDIQVWFDYNPEISSFGITWGILEGTVKGPNKDGDWVGTLKFKDNVTLGSLIETMVEWVTGVKFGLEAPWDILNSISLSKLELHFTFNKQDKSRNNVGLSVKIGPIDLGIMKIESVDLNYVTGKPNKKDNGVQISLTGSFPWNVGANQLGDENKLGPWDASQPGAAPAPPGGGNKYFDLRLLALGQHVTVPGLIEEKSLSGVITKLENLSIPKPPDIPLGGDNQPVFDANSSWFVAFDFGILKVEKPAQRNGSEMQGAPALPAPRGRQSHALVPAERRPLPTRFGADDKEQYFISLAIVFNDPYLYGLRLGLDGPMAKVFAGLEFEVMYQQVSENVGKYSGVIALPSIMRKLQVGVASITLPKFGVEVYTNGDFQIDLGFPWKEDFSIAFGIELQAGPFPVTGAAGLYFGKLSSATTTKVPATTKGWFNPVIAFGFGAQIGLGKSIEAGILKAGFSLTVFGIIEGVIARWLPYGTPTPGGDKSELQDGYYFALTGTMGVQGRLYGSIDFAIISAELNVAIAIYVRITFASYEPIPITAKASVDVSLTVKINLGLFSISISLGFKADIEATFVLENPMKGPAPWAIDSEQRVSTRIHTLPAPARLTARGLRKAASRQGSRLFALPVAASVYIPNWDNLQRGTVLNLQGWVAPVLTIAGDIAGAPDQQKICYVVNFFLESEKPIQAHEGGELATSAAQVIHRREVAHVALERSRNLSARAAGTNKFEDLAVRVLQWVIAAGQSSPLGPEDVDKLVISDDSLAAALSYLSGSTTPTPIPEKAIEAFLNLQTQFLFNLKEDATGDGDSAPVVFFPAAPGITLDVPAFAGSQKYQYSFGGYNSSSSGYLDALNKYFNQLKVQVQEEQKKEKLTAGNFAVDGGPSIATYIFGDYFAMIGRLTIQAIRDGLRNYKLVIADSAGKTVQQIVDDINNTGALPPDEAFTVGELFVANQTHALNLSARPAMIVAGMKWPAAGGKSFVSLAAESVFGGSFDAMALALANAANTTIIAPGVTIVFGRLSYTTQSNDSLVTIAFGLELVDVPTLLARVPAILSDPKLLAPQSILEVPQFSHSITAGDTLQKVASRYGIDLDALANANGGITDLFDAGNDPNLNVPHLSQYRVGALIEEMKRTLALQHLSAMVSRYYLHGLRLPTSYGNEKLTPNADGLFVQKGGQYPADLGLYALTGQAFPLSANIPDPSKQNPRDPNFSFSLNRGNEGWLSLGSAGSASVTYTLTDKHGNSDYLRYQSVKSLALAVGGYLNTGSFNIRPLDLTAIKPARYPLSSEIPWQPAVPVVLPNQSVNPPTPRPALWTLPTDLINLPNGTPIHPTLKPVLARTDESKGTTVDEGVNNYGFGTLITFTVKKIPASGSDGLAHRTYEIIGAPESEITLLERLLNQLRDDASSFEQVALFYHPSATGSQAKGWESDDAAASLMGITQTNLSTETRPPTASSLEAVGPAGDKYPNLIGTPNEFLRLLWEASITRQGGFYLTYTKGIGGDMKGLPDHAFNDRGEAELAVLALFTRGAADKGQALTNYTNVVVTNEPFDLSHAALVVETVRRDVTGRNFDAADTLASYASLYYSRPDTLAQENSTVVFNAVDSKGGSLKVTVSGGVYEVPPRSAGQPTRENPGGDLALIAQHFNTSIEEIKKVNAAGDSLPNQLDPYTAIKLPQISVAAEGNSFDSLSKYYHAPISQIAAANCDVVGLFAAKSLNVTIGPLTKTPLVKQGVAGMTLQRIAPEVPSQPGDAWAKAFLQQNFSLLGYRVSNNPQNPYFRESNWGLPSGPINPNPTGDGDKIQAPRATGAEETWNFSLAVPYASVFANEQPNPSPYAGVGGILQFGLTWIDIFGNRILSELDNPSPAAGTPLNKVPQITGYTDRLLGIGQWPAVAHAYQVIKNPSTGLSSLKIELDFDASAYAAAASSASGNDEVAAESGKQKLQQAIAVYELIIQQLTDPAGVTISVTTTITPQANWIIPDQSTADEQSLKAWAAAILAYLKALLAGPTTTPPVPPEYSFEVTLDSSKINTDQIFKLSVTLTVSRKPEFVAGELSDAPGVTEAATLIAPLTGSLTSNLDAVQPQRSLALFAADFTAAFPPGLGVSYRIATGADRMVFTGSGKSPLWVVQLGNHGAGQAISYTITNTGNPTVFAPRPISNVLQSKEKTSIIEYQTGAVISLDGPAQDRSFSSIDLDNWMRVTLTAIDELLTTKYVSPAEILRRQIQTVTPPPGGWKDALQELLDSKKSLADKLRVVMIPVYEGENANDQQLKDIREVFYQRMLGTMGQFYSVQAGVQFEADVLAAITPQSSDERVPRIFGDIVQASKSSTSLSSPKLDLKFGGGSKPSSPYLSSLVSATATDAKKVELDLEYNAQFIEHQIGTLEGIEGYQASSWLSFVDISASKLPAKDGETAPLRAKLGKFDVPIVLREFPDTPALVNQDMVSRLTSPCYQPLTADKQGVRSSLLLSTTECPKPGTYNPLTNATRWNYAFKYSMQVHYQQDEIHGQISFNVANPTRLRDAAKPKRDLFDNLAQFTQVFPKVSTDLNTFLVPIEVGESDPVKLQNAQFALESAATMINWIADSASGLPEIRADSNSPAAGSVDPLKFTISEDGVEKENPDKQKVIALRVTVTLESAPLRVALPMVEIDGYTCERASGDDQQKGIFFYRNKDNEYLPASDAKNIPGRTFILPDMDILERQNSQTEIYLSRNADIVPNKTIAKPFIYQTPHVSFERPLYPTLFNDDPINLATIYAGSADKTPAPVKRTLACQLSLFYEALFANAGTNDTTLQLGLSYAYAINNEIQEIQLPVYLMPPTKVAIRKGGSGIPLEDIINTQVAGWDAWVRANVPETDKGTLLFDLTAMSDLTERPMPILKMTGLYLPVADLV